MNCKQAQLNILLKDSGELSGNQQKDLDIHLKGCEYCAKYDKTMQSVMDLAIQNMPDNGPSDEILDNINKQAKAVNRRSLIFRRHIIQWAAAAALVLIVIGNWSFSPQTRYSDTKISDMYAILALVTDNAYNSDNITDDNSQNSVIPDMEDLLLQMEDSSEDYDPTEEELWVPQTKSPQSYNNRETQQKIYGQ